MDETYMKERNYRQVMFIRHQNEREERKLDSTLYDKHGIKAIHQWNMQQLSQEKDKLMNEIVNMRNITTTTWGFLPPRPGQEHREMAAKVDPLEKIIAAEKMMKLSSNRRKPNTRRVSPVKSLKDFNASDDEVDDVKGTAGNSPIKTSESSPGKLENISELDVKKAKQNVFSRLTSNKKSKKSRSSSLECVDEKQMFMPNRKNTGKPPTGKVNSNTRNNINKPPTIVLQQKPEGQLPRPAKVVTIIVSNDSRKANNNVEEDVNTGKADAANGNKQKTDAANGNKEKTDAANGNKENTDAANGNKETADADAANGNTTTTTNHNAEPVRPGRLLTPIKEGTTLTEKSGPGGKRISNRQYSFARSSTKGSIQVKGGGGGRKRKNTAKSDESEEFNKHNPDGTLRTIHNLPNFMESIEEAQNARYLRMKMKPWFEREMSVSDVWKDRDKPLVEKLRLK